MNAMDSADRNGLGIIGAATSVLAAASPLLQGIGGRYLEDCQEAQTIASRADSDGRHGVAPYALDPDNARRLWEISERLLNNPPPVEPYAPGSWGPESVKKLIAPYHWNLPDSG